VGPLITEKDTQRTIINGFGLLQQQVCFLLVDLANDEGWHDLVNWVKAQPDPLVAIQLL
jgi:hypothetical protein